MNLKDSTVLIIGLARSGLGAAKLCVNHGARVWICDSKKKEVIKEEVIREAEAMQVTCFFGRNPDEEMLSQVQYLILSPGVPTDLPFIVKAREMGVTVWGEVELAFHFCKAPLIGITGTNGKTTTTALTGEIVTAGYPGAVVVGNIGIAFTLRAEEPDVDDYVIAELSSFQLETIETFHPHVSAVLNITPDHLNRHKTMQRYMEAKQNVYANQNESDYCVLNYDDLECRRMGQEIMAQEKGPKVVYFSRTEKNPGGLWIENDWIISDIHQTAEPIVRVSDMKIFGAHNEENMLAAIGCSICAEVPADTIRKAAVQFKGVEHRIEYIDTINEVPYYNDSKATNTDAAIKGLLAMRSKVILIGGGMDKQIPFDDWTQLMPGRVKKLLLIGETKDMIRESALKAGVAEEDIIDCVTLEETVIKAHAYAEPGDCVLLSPACASWDMFESFEQRGDLFREYVQHIAGLIAGRIAE